MITKVLENQTNMNKNLLIKNLTVICTFLKEKKLKMKLETEKSHNKEEKKEENLMIYYMDQMKTLLMINTIKESKPDQDKTTKDIKILMKKTIKEWLVKMKKKKNLKKKNIQIKNKLKEN